MATANVNAVKYAELTDEHIKDIKEYIESFVKEKQFWGKFVHNVPVKRGTRTFQVRRLVKPIVKEEDIVERAEFTAPRPTKITVQTFEHSVKNYGDKAIYSREDLQYHFDDTVANIRDVLNEIAVQKLDLIKGKPFVSSACLITYDTSFLNTQRKAAVVLRKNKANRWDGTHYLCILTPEAKLKLTDELAAKGDKLSEPCRVELDGVPMEFQNYGDFSYVETTSEVLYKNDTTQYVIFMGKRGIDGNYPVDAAKLQGEEDIELINKGLGNGVLVDVDGNYTSDDNNQQGSVAINMDGLGAYVNDDLCILDCEMSINEIKGSGLVYDVSDNTGFVSQSGNDIKINESLGDDTEFAYKGVSHITSGTAYGAGSTIIAIQVKAETGKTLGTVGTTNWTATYKQASGGDNINCEILGVVKTAAANDTLVLRLPENPYNAEITVSSSVTASANA